MLAPSSHNGIFILTLGNTVVFEGLGIKVFEDQSFCGKLPFHVIPSVLRVGPKVVSLAEIVREDNICRYSIVWCYGAIVTKSKRGILDWADEWLPETGDLVLSKPYLDKQIRYEIPTYFNNWTRQPRYFSASSGWKWPSLRIAALALSSEYLSR